MMNLPSFVVAFNPPAQEISVTLIASQLTKATRVESLLVRAEDLFKKKEEISKETEDQIGKILFTSRNLPKLV